MSNAWPRRETEPAGRECAGVAPSIIFAAFLFCVMLGMGQYIGDEQQDLLLVEEWRMEWIPRGKPRSGPNLADIILRVAVVTVSATDDFCTADSKLFALVCVCHC